MYMHTGHCICNVCNYTVNFRPNPKKL